MSPHEFDCAICKRHIISFGDLVGYTLCATCMNAPGWHLDPELRKVFEPDSDDWEVPPIKPEEFIGFELFVPGTHGTVKVGDVLTLEQLQTVNAAQGEQGMLALFRIKAMQRNA